MLGIIFLAGLDRNSRQIRDFHENGFAAPGTYHFEDASLAWTIGFHNMFALGAPDANDGFNCRGHRNSFLLSPPLAAVS